LRYKNEIVITDKYFDYYRSASCSYKEQPNNTIMLHFNSNFPIKKEIVNDSLGRYLILCKVLYEL